MKSLSIVSIFLLGTIVFHVAVEAHGIPQAQTTQGQQQPQGGSGADCGPKKFCMPKQTTCPKNMELYMNEACKCGIDCSPIQLGGCCEKNCIMIRAGFAMTLAYRKTGKCDWNGTAELVEQDPSKGTCKFP